MSDLSIRVISGVIGIIALIAIMITGGLVLKLALMILSIVALFEFYKAISKIDLKPIMIVGYLSSILFLSSLFFEKITVDLIFTVLMILSLSITVFGNKFSIKDVAATFIGILYIPFLLYHLIYLDGTKFMWLVFIIAFGTDTFAYLVGTKFGKHKLCPHISPKKSVEGAIGGIVGSIVLSVIYGIFFEIEPLWSLGIMALVGSIVSQIGDLTASRIKRLVGIKDFGKLMPGHGGALDRFDSIIFAAPFVYYYAYLFLK